MFAEYNKQEEKELKALLIGGVIASAEFKEIIKQAVKEGIGEDWKTVCEDHIIKIQQWNTTR